MIFASLFFFLRGVESLFIVTFYLLIKSYSDIYSAFGITFSNFILGDEYPFQMQTTIVLPSMYTFFFTVAHFHRFQKKENRRQCFYHLCIILAKFTLRNILDIILKKRDNLTVSLNSTSSLGKMYHF